VTGASGPALPSDGVLADVYRAADGPTRSALREAIAGIAQLADTSIADLESVTGVLDSPASAGLPPARAFLELLRDYLELRFVDGLG
jgi:hypothetical protein